MSWEAFRLTSKSPSELMTTLGPHAVDHLIRQALDAVWREYPEENRTFENVRRRAQEVFDRNMRVWSKIKKPAPAAFFDNLLPYAADGHMRQALVLCWMMLPRTGGRKFSDVQKIVRGLWERNTTSWQEDHRTFTGPTKKPATRKPKSSKKPAKIKAKPVKKKKR